MKEGDESITLRCRIKSKAYPNGCVIKEHATASYGCMANYTIGKAPVEFAIWPSKPVSCEGVPIAHPKLWMQMFLDGANAPTAGAASKPSTADDVPVTVSIEELCSPVSKKAKF